MKRSTTSILALLFLIVVGFMACDKNEINYGEFEKISGAEAFLKVNYNIAYAANPDVQIKINGVRVSPLIKTRYPFPGGGYNTLGDSRPDYLQVTPGSVTVSVVIPKKGTNIDSVELYKTSVVTEQGKNYTLHLTDTAANTKSVFTTDDLALPDSGFAKHRFINLMPNVPAIDLYYGTTLVAANVGYLKTSDYFTIQAPGTGKWDIRVAGSAATSAVIQTYTSASTTTNRRCYTAFATGYTGYPLTVVAPKVLDHRRPMLAFFLIK